MQRPPGWVAFVLGQSEGYWRSSVQLVPPLGS